VFVEGHISVDQLKDFIMETIKDKSESTSTFPLTYEGSYSPRIDNLKIHVGYQPPKLQEFEDEGHSKQRVAHFVKT